MSALYRRRPDVTERRLGNSVFLARPGNGGVDRLNETGAALWRLLEEPLGRDDAVRVFRTAFPRQPSARLARQVEDLLTRLVEGEFVEEFTSELRADGRVGRLPRAKDVRA